MKENLTPWFPAKVKPIHIGVYEVDMFSGKSIYAYWDGKKFGYRTFGSQQRAFEQRNMATSCPALTTWRGLAEKP